MPVMDYFHNDVGSFVVTGNAKIGVKARFLDEETSGIAVSTYPQYEFNNSSIADENKGPQLFLSLEAAKSFGKFHCAAEAGYTFIASGLDELAYDQSEHCELLTELHSGNHIHAGLEEILFNLGLTYVLTPSLGFLASAGTTVYSPERSRTYTAYLGIRWIL
jgi:hypothetical protein